jgi:hypothetical protein
MIHQNAVKEAIFESTDKRVKVAHSMVGFVDDNNNCITCENSKAPITHTLQESAQKWEKLLFAAGGNPTK